MKVSDTSHTKQLWLYFIKSALFNFHFVALQNDAKCIQRISKKKLPTRTLSSTSFNKNKIYANITQILFDKKDY